MEKIYSVATVKAVCWNYEEDWEYADKYQTPNINGVLLPRCKNCQHAYEFHGVVIN